MGFKPECAGSHKWVCSSVLPPQSFIAAAMDLAMVRATERHRKLVTHRATECTKIARTANDEDPTAGDRRPGTVA